jgi:hypothetical protein
MLVVCRTILRDIALNALGVRPEEFPGQKQESLYNLSDSHVVNIQTSLREVCLSQGASFSLINSSYYITK